MPLVPHHPLSKKCERSARVGENGRSGRDGGGLGADVTPPPPRRPLRSPHCDEGGGPSRGDEAELLAHQPTWREAMSLHTAPKWPKRRRGTPASTDAIGARNSTTRVPQARPQLLQFQGVVVILHQNLAGCKRRWGRWPLCLEARLGGALACGEEKAIVPHAHSIAGGRAEAGRGMRNGGDPIKTHRHWSRRVLAQVPSMCGSPMGKYYTFALGSARAGSKSHRASKHSRCANGIDIMSDVVRRRQTIDLERQSV